MMPISRPPWIFTAFHQISALPPSFHFIPFYFRPISFSSFNVHSLLFIEYREKLLTPTRILVGYFSNNNNNKELSNDELASLAFLSQTTHTRPQQLGSWSSKMFFFSSNSFAEKRKVNFDFFFCSVLWTAFSVCTDKRERKRKKICQVTEKSYFVWSTFSRHRRGQ